MWVWLVERCSGVVSFMLWSSVLARSVDPPPAPIGVAICSYMEFHVHGVREMMCNGVVHVFITPPPP